MNAALFSDPLMLLPLAAFGLIFGSFVTALSYRLPRGESVAHGRSRCGACGHTLAARDLVPVLSWIAHGGACRYCGTKVSWRYPAIEVMTMTLFVATGFIVREPLHLLLLLAATPVMVALAVIDLEHRRLPNGLVAALAVLAVIWRAVNDGGVLAGFAAAAAVLVVGVALNAAYQALKGKSGLGMGDTKLFAVAGMALAMGPFLLCVTLAGVSGVVFGAIWRARTDSMQFPFGPAILAALWVCLAAGEQLLQRLTLLFAN